MSDWAAFTEDVPWFPHRGANVEVSSRRRTRTLSPSAATLFPRFAGLVAASQRVVPRHKDEDRDDDDDDRQKGQSERGQVLLGGRSLRQLADIKSCGLRMLPHHHVTLRQAVDVLAIAHAIDRRSQPAEVHHQQGLGIQFPAERQELGRLFGRQVIGVDCLGQPVRFERAGRVVAACITRSSGTIRAPPPIPSMRYSGSKKPNTRTIR